MIRVGVIGAGFMGRNHFNQYEKLTDRASVVALCDKEADRRAGDWSKVGGNIADSKGSKRDLGSIKPYTEWRDLINDPNIDLVDLCVPTFVHREIAVAALKAGKHVLCEKPMALSVEECDEMIAAAKGSKGRFMIAQVIRFWPEHVYLRKVIEDKRFGELKALHLRRQASAPDYTLGNWILNPKLSGGAILDLHVHDVDYVIGLFGKPKSIYAQAHQRGEGSFDRVHALWNYGDGRVVHLEGYWDMPAGFGFNHGFTAVFEKAGILYDLNAGKPLTLFQPGQEPQTPELPKDDGYYSEIEYFVSCIEKGREPKLSTPQQSRDAVALALAEKKSAASGEAVSIS